MDTNERKPHALEDRLEAYAAWVGDLRRGHSPSHLPEDTAAPLDKLNHELQLLADVITRAKTNSTSCSKSCIRSSAEFLSRMCST